MTLHLLGTCDTCGLRVTESSAEHLVPVGEQLGCADRAACFARSLAIAEACARLDIRYTDLDGVRERQAAISRVPEALRIKAGLLICGDCGEAGQRAGGGNRCVLCGSIDVGEPLRSGWNESD